MGFRFIEVEVMVEVIWGRSYLARDGQMGEIKVDWEWGS